MAKVLDHIADISGSELSRLEALYGNFPDFVKTASYETTFQPMDLTLSVYADPTQKLYPCHTSASTWLSALYYNEKKAEFHPKIAGLIEERLNKAIKYWGIKAATDLITTKYAELHSDPDSKLPDRDFAYVWTGHDPVKNASVKRRSLRVKSAAEVKAAAEWLQLYTDALPFSDRNVIARKIHEKAAQYGANLGKLESFIEKQAGYGICEPAEVVTMIKQRAMLTKNAECRQGIQNLADTIEKLPRIALQPGMLIKLAETIDALDRTQLGLSGKYTDVIQRPENVLFAITYKEAEAGVGNAVALTTGKIYNKSDFKKIALHDVQALFGNAMANDVADGVDVDCEKMAELAETMPRDDAEQFEQILRDTQIRPIHVKAADDRYGVTAAAQQQLAAAY